MSKRAGTLLPASCNACVDVDTQPARDVLRAIENAADQNSHQPPAKRQRCIVAPCGDGAPPAPGALFREARRLLRSPPAGPGASGTPLGREQQAEKISTALKTFLDSGAGGALYVSGLPGTGKSHTVRSVLQATLTARADTATVVWLNCMSCSNAGEIHARLAAAAEAGGSLLPLAGATGTADEGCDVALGGNASDRAVPLCTSLGEAGGGRPALNSISCAVLEQRLAALQGGASDAAGCAAATPVRPTRARRASAALHGRTAPRDGAELPLPAPPPRRLVLVLDEIDALARRGNEDLVALFMLPRSPKLSLLLVGIANSIDLTQRALPELQARLATPTLIPFPSYSTAQLGAILSAAADALPTRLFDPPALELCARSVASSTGDLRHALKACRCALDELERLHQQQEKQQQEQKDQEQQQPGMTACAPSSLRVNVRLMLGALSRIAGVRSSQFGTQTCSGIRALPNQQQLLLYSLSVLCRPRGDDVAQTATATTQQQLSTSTPPRTSRLWETAGSAVPLSGGGRHPSTPGSVRKATHAGHTPARSPAPGTPGASRVFMLAATLDDAHAQYRAVCRLLALPPCSRAELAHMAELLAQAALVDVLRPPGAGAGGTGGLGGGGCGRAKGGKLRGRDGLGGLGGAGGLGSLAARGRGGAGLCRSGGISGGGQELRLALRLSAEEVEGALRANPALRCLVT